ncbi:MAG: RecQ family ATP-dependent DNA helicase [Clostridiales bacterium]|nr:RecQ family ATP-dependent DNA helicase [Clostridiales bacterium]
MLTTEMKTLVFIDLEVDADSGRVLDIGAVTSDGRQLHTNCLAELERLFTGQSYVCGHNILAHDLNYVRDLTDSLSIFSFIDTLPLSPLLFPNKPYHHLLKDEKLQTDEKNNPMNDSIKARDLFYDEWNAWNRLDMDMRNLYRKLLSGTEEFRGFFEYEKEAAETEENNRGKAGWRRFPVIAAIRKSATRILHNCPENKNEESLETLIARVYRGKICEAANLSSLIQNRPVELAYALALLSAENETSTTPGWVLVKYPEVENVLHLLRNVSCGKCAYCMEKLDIHQRLQSIFHYKSFRIYNGEALQEHATQAAVDGESLLAIFPTGGGKSITFQLPALIAGDTVRGLTVVISPLQSLMKDQVDNLEKLGITDAVTVNGLLDAIERKNALERVENGEASILYISPESLRSRTIERILLSRHIVRFVVDEAHCFSAWGQDFRVDYLYIGEFIRRLQNAKRQKEPIPISCFTATAKQKVISDIREYFQKELSLDLKLYATSAARTNLHYAVLFKETEEKKYSTLRNLIESRDCATIVYVSRTKKARELAERLSKDGFAARPYHGKMERQEKTQNQEDFIHDKVQIIVATSAFGMGVDKSNVRLVVHFDISDSLENYVQEAGRAGRDQSLEAECFVLFNNADLDKHFILLNQTKLSISEIQQIWKAIKDLTRKRDTVVRSPLEIARQAGWDESVVDVETRVKTAVSALETAGYVKRGRNVPRVYADSILAPDMRTASMIIEQSKRFDEKEKETARRILSRLYSSRSISTAQKEEPESRVDYLADRLGLSVAEVIRSISMMREEQLLGDAMDMTAYMDRRDSGNKSVRKLSDYLALEKFLLDWLASEEDDCLLNLKEINEQAEERGLTGTSVNALRRILYYWTIRGDIEKVLDSQVNRYPVRYKTDLHTLQERQKKRTELAGYLVEWMYAHKAELPEKDEAVVQFSVMGLKQAYENPDQLSLFGKRSASLDEVEDALLYLSKIDALRLEGGFLVVYNTLEITRLEMDNRIRYKREDYRQLNEYYQMKMQQIHIVGEYARLMVRNYEEALAFVNDYFQMDYRLFQKKYFKGNRLEEINRNITPEKYEELFGSLSARQREIIQDDHSRCIVVAAGPGSGKTRILVHKLASLLQLEDVRHEQLLMLTFSRAAVTEFKERLAKLIGHAAWFVEIKTFHSYAFDLLGRVGDLEKLDEDQNVIRAATEMIRNGDVESGRVTKTALVIDEAQDIDEAEYALIQALIEKNEEMRVIAVGDDDQNVYGFRGSDSRFMQSLVTEYHATVYELLDNYRSSRRIVAFANVYAQTIVKRMKNNPIHAVKEEDGEVTLIRFRDNHFERAVVEDVVRLTDAELTEKEEGEESIGILTATNLEAANLVFLLEKRQSRLPVVLVGSDDDFDLTLLVEVDFFMRQIRGMVSGPVIAPEDWKKAVDAFGQFFKKSSCYEPVLCLLEKFKETNKTMYVTDLESFLHESRLGDGYERGERRIYVSTIHKAKGREFDHVYLMLKNYETQGNDERKRAVYVACTRARKKLHVYCNNQVFEDVMKGPGDGICRYSEDGASHPAAEFFVMQLRHRDVHLGCFKEWENQIRYCRSGDELMLEADGMHLSRMRSNGQRQRVLRFSNSCKKQIEKWKSSGYEPVGARIRCMVMWKGKDEERAVPIILPNLYFRIRTPEMSVRGER